MNHQNRDFCYYHPKQLLVGVCPFCLNEKLLAVAAQEGRRSRRDGGGQTSQNGKSCNNNVRLPKMFALRSLLNRLELRRRHRHRRRSSHCDDLGSDFQSTSTSLGDSFISIKFEDNGVALWDKSKENPCKTFKSLSANTNDDNCKKTKIAEMAHIKTTPRGSLRWRKRIGHLLHLVRWKKSNKGSGRGASHVDGVAKVRSKGWIRTFTRRRTSKE